MAGSAAGVKVDGGTVTIRAAGTYRHGDGDGEGFLDGATKPGMVTAR